MAGFEQRPFEAAGRGGITLRGWTQGEGPPLLLAHGITAHRDLVVHGSSHLPRAGFRLIAYNARSHGESDPGPAGSHDYETLVADLEAVVEAEVGSDERPVLCGHSMGAHTVLAAAIAEPERYAGLVVIGPVSEGEAPSEDALSHWDGLAAGLAEGGVEGWLEAYESGDFDPDWEETLIRIATERMQRHEHPGALAEALREVPRSLPYRGLEPLERLQLPVLVIASHDAADPGHPYATAERIAERLPNAELRSEDEGESPLAWQGGKLSREIEEFAGRVL